MNDTFSVPTSEDLVNTGIGINAVLSLPLNCYVIWLILAGARDTLVADFFSLNLALSEVVCVLSSIWYILFLYWKPILFLLDAYIFTRAFRFTARPLFQCLICAECYVGVVHPVLFLQLKRLRYKVICCCAAWLIVLVFCLYGLCTYQDTLYLYGDFVSNLVLFCIMLFCCLAVLKALKRPGPGAKATQQKSNAKKRKALKIISLIMISMAVPFFLYAATIPLQCCMSTEMFSNTLTISVTLALMVGFTQPLLYLHRSGKLICFKKVNE